MFGLLILFHDLLLTIDRIFIMNFLYNVLGIAQTCNLFFFIYVILHDADTYLVLTKYMNKSRTNYSILHMIDSIIVR